MSSMEAENCHGLSSEMLEYIFKFCRHSDLASICRTSKRLYMIATPVLYRHFTPNHWTQIVRLKKCLKHGMGPASVNPMAIAESVVKRIRSIDLQVDDRWVDIGRDSGDYRTFEWALETTLRSIIYIVKRAKNLRSFASLEAFSELDLAELFDALGQHSIEKLVLPHALGGRVICDASLKLFSRDGMKKLHLTSSKFTDYCDENDRGSGLRQLLHSSSGLVDLRIDLPEQKARRSAPNTHIRLRQLDIFSVRCWSHLRFLELYQCYAKADEILQFLSTLPRLEMLRYLGNPATDREASHYLPLVDWTNAKGGLEVSFPALKVLECVDAQLLVELLHHSKLEVLFMDWSHLSTESIAVLEGVLSDQHSLKEAHFRGFEGFVHRAGDRASMVTLVQSIPASLQRIAFRSQSSLELDSSQEDHCSNLGRALNHLTNLERVFLPENCHLSGLAASLGSHSKLEWIFSLEETFAINPRLCIKKCGSLYSNDLEEIATELWYGAPESFCTKLFRRSGIVERALKITRSPFLEPAKQEEGIPSTEQFCRRTNTTYEWIELFLPD